MNSGLISTQHSTLQYYKIWVVPTVVMNYNFTKYKVTNNTKFKDT